MRKKKPLQNR